jgi:hypothetical protein
MKNHLNNLEKSNIHCLFSKYGFKKSAFYTVHSTYPFAIKSWTIDGNESYDGLVTSLFKREEYFKKSRRKVPKKLALLVDSIKMYFPEELI